MAQNLIPKRQQIAIKGVNAATRIVEAVTALEQASADLAQTGGTFEIGDFDGAAGLEHLSPSVIGTLLGPVVVALGKARDTHLDPADPASPTIGAILRQAKQG
jgi:hypothetical protein